MLNRDQVRAFYNRMGKGQDTQSFYEEPAIKEILAHARFETAQSVFELGCGTGRLAEKLLDQYLPSTALYRGVDVSPKMVQIAQDRLARFGARAQVEIVAGNPNIPAPDHSADRFLSTYVLDLLPPDEIRAFLAEAHRILAPEGYLCLASLTQGKSLASRLVIGAWEVMRAMNPALVGGCRPLELIEFLDPANWEGETVQVVSGFGVPSEVVIARPLSG